MANELQNVTPNTEAPDTEVAIRNLPDTPEVLAWKQQQYVDWYAAGGLRVHEDGDFEEITATKFAEYLNVSRMTLWRWSKTIPGFQELVGQRRAELFAGARVNQVWKGVYLRATAGEYKQADMILRNFDPNYKAPNAKEEDDNGLGLADLLQLARQAENGTREIIQVEDATISDRA